MYRKRFNVQSAEKKRIMQGLTDSFWDSVSCRKYTEVNNCVVCGVQRKTDYFSKTPSSGPRKCDELSLCVAVPLFIDSREGYGLETHVTHVINLPLTPILNGISLCTDFLMRKKLQVYPQI